MKRDGYKPRIALSPMASSSPILPFSREQKEVEKKLKETEQKAKKEKGKMKEAVAAAPQVGQPTHRQR
jgi:hypothetical protein